MGEGGHAQPHRSDVCGRDRLQGVLVRRRIWCQITMDSQFASANVPGGNAAPTFTSQLYVKFDLVKTGPITPGKLSINTSGGASVGWRLCFI
ncbi:hypothetical protein B0G76_3472 [Paraburkholderia sp. BL23I1N1]|nr:hypothetical protein B0G76_3472 [Paraburkholderia sp. BL23I1N1]